MRAETLTQVANDGYVGPHGVVYNFNNGGGDASHPYFGLGGPKVKSIQCLGEPSGGSQCVVQLSGPVKVATQLQVTMETGETVPLNFAAGTSSIQVAEKRRIKSVKFGKTITPAAYK